MIHFRRAYFDYLTRFVIPDDQNEPMKALKMDVLRRLHDIPFRYSIPLDANRVSDAINLRYRFGRELHIEQSIIASEIDCREASVLEVLIALAIRIELDVMDNEYTDYTPKWFWIMIDNMELLDPDDFDEQVDVFLDRLYTKTGCGGPFRFNVDYISKHPDRDMRTSELWDQAMWYITEYYNG